MKTVEEYRKMLQTFPNGIYRTSIKTGEFLEANQNLADMLGYESPEILKSSISSKDLYIDIEDRKRFIDYLRLNNGDSKPQKIKFLTKYNDIIWVLITGHINEEEGYIDGAVIDITDTMTGQIETLSAITEVIKRRVQEIDKCDNNFFFELKVRA